MSRSDIDSLQAATREGGDAMSVGIEALNNSTIPVLVRWTKTTSQLRRVLIRDQADRDATWSDLSSSFTDAGTRSIS